MSIRNTSLKAVAVAPQTAMGSARRSRKPSDSRSQRRKELAETCRSLFERGYALSRAAASTPQTGPVASETRLPVEVELVGQEASKYMEDLHLDLFVRLQEPDPDDAGILSGAALRILDAGPRMRLMAETDSLQRNGMLLSHCLGITDDPAPLIENDTTSSAGVPVIVWLRESGYTPRTGVYSGVTIQLFGGEVPELLLCAGPHAIGVLRGKLLTQFLDAVNFRLSYS